MEPITLKQFKVTLFGTPKIIEAKNSLLTPIPAGQGKIMLPFYLLLLHKSEMPRRELSKQVGDETTDTGIPSAFRKQMNRLQKKLEEFGILLQTREDGNTTYESLDFSQFDVDVWRFDDLYKQIRQEKDRDVKTLHEVLKLYHPPLLQGYKTKHLQTESASYFRKALDIIEDLEARGILTPEQKIVYLEEWFRSCPSDESIGRQLMYLFDLYQQPERCDVVYHAMEEAVAPEKLEAITETKYRFIKEKRISRFDFSRQRETPVSPPLYKIPAPYPQPLINRVRDRQGLLKRLQSHRLVTLVGAGGVGKTRLAETVAREQMLQMPEGAVFVSLAHLSLNTTIDELKGVICDELENSSLEEGLKNRRILLVLDNAEHVREVVASLLHTLLSQYSDLRVLVTSREPLGIEGEQAHLLEPLALPLPAAFATPQSIVGSEAVALLLTRIPDPHFVITEENAALIAELCHYSAGIPLAIEMIATHIRQGQPLERLWEKLQKGIEILEIPRDPMEAEDTPKYRQMSMEKTLSWSYRTLPFEAGLALISLCVFTTEFSEPAAATLWNIPEARAESLLRRFQHKSLLQTTLDGKYRLHMVVHQYLQTQWTLMADNTKIAIETRFISYYANLATLHAQNVPVLVPERENLINALMLAIKQKNKLAVVALIDVVWRLCMSYGGLTRLYHKLAQIEATLLEIASFSALKGLGNVAYLQGDFLLAHRCFLWCQQDATSRNDLHDEASMFGNLSNVLMEQKQIIEADQHLRQSIELFESMNDHTGAMRGWSNLANLELQRGDLSKAIAHHYHALEHGRLSSNTNGLCLSLNNLAHTLLLEKRFEEVYEILQEVLEIYQREDLPRVMIHTLTILVSFFTERKQRQDAIFYAGATEALRQYHQIPLTTTNASSFNDVLHKLQKESGEASFIYWYQQGRETAANRQILLRELLKKLE
jgi:predicted ATPase